MTLVQMRSIFLAPPDDVLAAFDSGKHRGPTRIDFHFHYDRKPMSTWNKIALNVFSQAFVEQYAAEDYSISTVFERIKEHFRGRRKAFRQIQLHLSDAQLALQQHKARSSSRRISVSLRFYISTLLIFPSVVLETDEHRSEVTRT